MAPHNFKISVTKQDERKRKFPGATATPQMFVFDFSVQLPQNNPSDCKYIIRQVHDLHEIRSIKTNENSVKGQFPIVNIAQICNAEYYVVAKCFGEECESPHLKETLQQLMTAGSST